VLSIHKKSTLNQKIFLSENNINQITFDLPFQIGIESQGFVFKLKKNSCRVYIINIWTLYSFPPFPLDKNFPETNKIYIYDLSLGLSYSTIVTLLLQG